MKDLIIIGAGPAGLTAAIYARRSGLDVLVLEAKTYGGQIINTHKIKNYPAIAEISGLDFATDLYNQTVNLGAEIEFEKVTNIEKKENSFIVKTEDDEYEARAVIIATGADKRKLHLENEEKLTGHGVSYCATCDGNFFKDKIVAIYGGGNSAFYEAEYLSKLASKVYIVHRREGFRAEQNIVDRVKAIENVEFILNATIEKLNGEEKLESVELLENGEAKTLKLDGLFVSIGQEPMNLEFKNLVNIDEAGYIIAGEDCRTNIPGIFVAGDNRTKALRQIVTATSDGAIAASNALEYINKEK